jgi:putative hydrolase of HD superfamily
MGSYEGGVSMKTQELLNILEFIKEAEKLKSILRSGNTSLKRKESTAEHTWRLSLLTMILSQHLPECDPLKLMHLTIVHDIGELDEGDIPAIEQMDEDKKYKIEENTVKRLRELLPNNQRKWFYDLWLEYEEGKTLESKVVKILDKIETIIQHNQVDNGSDFDYGFNLTYGRSLLEEELEDNGLLKDLRDIVDAMTKENVDK